MTSVSDLIVASGQVKGGKLHIRNRRAFDDQIALVPERWELEITVARQRATRSQQQNSYYWGVVVQMLSDHTGYTPDEMHAYLKTKFIPKRLAVNASNGIICDELVIGGSTRTMSTIQFGEYMESIRQWAAETVDLYIPDPDGDTREYEQISQPKWYRASRRG